MLPAGGAPDALVGAPPPTTGRPFPVLLYFSGWPETSIQNRRLIDALVSQGYAVVTVIYPQATTGNAATAFMDFSSAAARADTQGRERARDASAELDGLAALDAGMPPSPFRAMLDLHRAGIFSYSFGGAIAAQAACRDARFKAAVNLDG